MPAANTFGRQVVVPLTNGSGGGVIAGDVVIVNTAANDGFTTTTSAATTAIVGIAQETIANAAVGRILLGGYAALVNVNASVTRGEYGGTHTVAKQAATLGAARIAGAFCQFLTGGTTPDAHIWPTDLGGGSGAPTTADYLTGTAQGGLSAEIVVGATPGGELGGTWASPTVDGTHAGSTHFPDCYESFLAADVTVTTANTFQDAMSLSLPTGTFWVVGEGEATSASGSGTFITLRIYDGTTVFAAKGGRCWAGDAGGATSLSVSARVVVAAGPVTVKVQVTSNRGTPDSILRDQSQANGTADKCTVMHAIKITAA